MGGQLLSSGDNGGGRRGGRRRGRRRARAMAEINVTPFVDVMLVLLIIFMVAAPLMTVGVPVELPKTAANALPSESEEPLTITLASDGSVAIQGTTTERANLITKLRRWLRSANLPRYSCVRMRRCLTVR